MKKTFAAIFRFFRNFFIYVVLTATGCVLTTYPFTWQLALMVYIITHIAEKLIQKFSKKEKEEE